MLRYLIVYAILLYSGLVYSDPETKQIHPDEPPSHTHGNRFSSENAIEALQIIDESLASFRKITEVATAEEPIILSRYKHTDWEMQNIGFANALATIEGTIRQQRYIIAKLKYEFSIENKSNRNTAEASMVETLKKKSLHAKNKYEAFLRNTKITD